MSLWASLWRGIFGGGSDNQSRWVILCVGVLVGFLGIFGMIRLIGGGVQHPGDGGASMVEPALPGPRVAESDRQPGEVDRILIEPATFQLKAEPLARRLVEARSVSEMLPLVRDPELTAPRMRDWYGRHGFDGLKINRFSYRNETSFLGSMASVSIMMSDFVKREMVFVADGDTLLIDWESWVGWSELPWSEFMEKRPASPKLFRVKAQLGNYFNYGFQEHSNWRCYEFESPDGEHLLFAYGEIGSEADNKLAGVEQRDKRALTVRLRYPENAPAANQVIIDEVLADRWVVLDEQSGSDE